MYKIIKLPYSLFQSLIKKQDSVNYNGFHKLKVEDKEFLKYDDIYIAAYLEEDGYSSFYKKGNLKIIGRAKVRDCCGNIVEVGLIEEIGNMNVPPYPRKSGTDKFIKEAKVL